MQLLWFAQTNLEKKIGNVDEKIRDTSDLVITTVFNTKFSENRNKNPDHAKYITTQELDNLIVESFTQATLISIIK